MITTIVNPAGHEPYNNAPADEIVANLGLLPSFVHYAEASHKPLSRAMIEAYGFPTYAIDDVEVDAEGAWRYPGDPALYPLAMMSSTKGIVLVYRYGFVAIKDGHHDEPFIAYRMD